MNFPIVSRSRYDRLLAVLKELNDKYIALQVEHDSVIGRACELADIEREDRAREREHFEAIVTNLRGEQ